MNRRRGVVVATLVVALVLAAGSAGIAWAARTPERFAVQAWLPSQPVPQAIGLAGQGPVATVSSAEGSVAQAVASLPDVGLAQLLLESLQSAGVDPLTALVERDYTTVTNDDGSVTSQIAVYTIDARGLSLAYVWDSSGSVIAFLPPAMYLPAEPTPGAALSQKGLTNAKAPYSVTEKVHARTGDCIEIARVLTQDVPGSDAHVSPTRDRWCLGQGNVSSRDDDVVLPGRLVATGDVALA